jgi:hypothetical protein
MPVGLQLRLSAFARLERILSIPENSSQNLATSALWNFVQDNDAASESLVLSQLRSHVVLHFRFESVGVRYFFRSNHIGSRQFARVLFRVDGDYARVGNLRMGEENAFELGGLASWSAATYTIK